MDAKEILKEKLNIESDKDLGGALGLSKSAVSVWKKQGVPKYITALLPYISNDGEFVLVPRYNVTGSCGGGADGTPEGVAVRYGGQPCYCASCSCSLAITSSAFLAA